MTDELVDHPADGLVRALVRRAEVPGPGVAPPLIEQEGAELQVSRERLKDVLPRANGVRIPDDDGLTCNQGPDRVGNDPVWRPVPASDDVARPGSCDRRALPEEACAVCRR